MRILRRTRRKARWTTRSEKALSSAVRGCFSCCSRPLSARGRAAAVAAGVYFFHRRGMRRKTSLPPHCLSARGMSFLCCGMIEKFVSHIHAWLLLLELASARGLLQLLASGRCVSVVSAVRPPLVCITWLNILNTLNSLKLPRDVGNWKYGNEH